MANICKSGKIGNDYSFLILSNNNEFYITLTTPTQQYKNITTTIQIAIHWIEQKINILQTSEQLH